MAALPEVPRHGLSLAALRAFMSEHAGCTFSPAADEVVSEGVPLPFEALTTAQVVQRVIKPVTVHTGGSYAELLLQKSADSNLVAPANVFISHAWQYPFADLIAVVLSHLAEEESTAYVWLDIFVGSQHKAAELPQEWWSQAFAHAVGDIGRTVAVLQPWTMPLPLKRSWCLWELFSTISSGAVLEMAIHPRERDDFGAALLDDARYARIIDELCQIDTRMAQAFLPADKHMIDAAVEASAGGFGKVNGMVLEKLREWLLHSATELHQRLETQLGELHPDTLSAMQRAAMLTGALGKIDTAASLLERVVAGRLATLGPTNEATLRARLSLVLFMQYQGKLQDAEVAGRCLLADVELALGATHFVAAIARNNLANVLQHQADKLAEAVALKKQALSDVRAARGDDSDDTVLVTTSYAYALQKSGQLAEAESLYRHALATNRATRGPRHPSTLGSMNLIAQLLREQGKLAEAEPLYRDALAAQRETVGHDHQHTLDSMRNLAALLRALGRPAEAEPLAEECARRCREKYGDAHRDTVSADAELAAVRAALCGGNADKLTGHMAAVSLGDGQKT